MQKLTTPGRRTAVPVSFRRRFALIAVLLLTALSPAATLADVILHAFNWRYADITARADALRDAGYKMVLVAPAYKSQGTAWWARYQPQDIRLIDNPLGNTETFKAMVQALNARGIRTYADIVFNHMANEAGLRSDLNYPGSSVLGAYAANRPYFNRQLLFGDINYNNFSMLDFGPKTCIGDYNNVYQVQTWRLCGGGGDVGLPDLLGNDWVVQQQQLYLRALKTIGVRGFRVDAAKHMSASHINRVFSSDIKSGVHVFGEVITGGGAGESEYESFLKPYLQITDHSAYDFPLLNSLRAAFGLGGSMNRLVDPLATGQALQSNRAITFAITHDIPNNSGFRYLIMDATDETLAYAYILGRNGGVPMVYTDNNESGDNRWVNAWNRADLKSMLRFHNATQGSDMQILGYSDCHLLFRRGDRGVVGINKCGSTINVPVNMNNSVLWWNTNYTDTLDSGSIVRISSGSYSFSLPPRRARMWLR